MDPAKIAETVYFLHTQHPWCWMHEIQVTAFVTTPSFERACA
jgi:hypothetical protein